MQSHGRLTFSIKVSQFRPGDETARRDRAWLAIEFIVIEGTRDQVRLPKSEYQGGLEDYGSIYA